MKLFCGRSNVPFAQDVGRALAAMRPHGTTGGAFDGNVPCIASSFNDGEPRVQIPTNVRDDDVFLIQSTFQPGDTFVELATMVNASVLASARRTAAVIPYFGFARQDRKVAPRTPITVQAICMMLEAVGVERVITTDLHAGQIQGMFRRPLDNLEAVPVLLKQIAADLGLTREQQFSELALVSPDDGGVERCREVGKIVDCGRVTFYLKGRDREGRIIPGGIIRDPSLVEGRTVLLIDDIVDTAGSIAKAAAECRAAGAARILVAVVHPVLSTNAETGVSAYEVLARAPIDRCYFTDTIPFSEARCRWVSAQEHSGPHREPERAAEWFHALAEKTTIVSVAKLFAGAIHELHSHGSVSSLFERTCHEIFP